LTLRVYLAGEGATELGSRQGGPTYQSGDEPGVLEQLLTLVHQEGWEVVQARQWKHFRSLRAGHHGPKDRRNVLAAALDARYAGCDVLVFSRDQDRDQARRDAIEAGVAEVSGTYPQLRVAGGVATQCIEAWVLALFGRPRTEELSCAAAARAVEDAGCSGWREMASRVAECELGRRAADADSLGIWLDRARLALTP
jgi:hypothetical protein